MNPHNVALLASGDNGLSGPGVINHVAVDRRHECVTTNVLVKRKKRLNCAMIRVVRRGMSGPNGAHVRHHVDVVSKRDPSQMCVSRLPIICNNGRVTPHCQLIHTIPGPSGNHAHHHVWVDVVFAQLNTFVVPLRERMPRDVVRLDSGWRGPNGPHVRSHVVSVLNVVNVVIRVTPSCQKRRSPSVKLVLAFTRNGPSGRFVQPNVLVASHDVTNTTIAVPSQLSRRKHVALTSGHCGPNGQHVHQHAPMEHVSVVKSIIVVPSQLSKKNNVVVAVLIWRGRHGQCAHNNVKVASLLVHVVTRVMRQPKRKANNVVEPLTMDNGRPGPSVMMLNQVHLSCAMAVSDVDHERVIAGVAMKSRMSSVIPNAVVTIHHGASGPVVRLHVVLGINNDRFQIAMESRFNLNVKHVPM